MLEIVSSYMWRGIKGFNMAPDLTEGERARRKALPDAARRALEEADARRLQQKEENQPAEEGGPKGAEPTRYGDWERKGRAVDF